MFQPPTVEVHCCWPDYQAAKAKRKGAPENDVIIVEGV